MALLWADGFDHYGTSAASRVNMLRRAYAEVMPNFSCSTTNPRNGTHSLVVTAMIGTPGVRWVLPSPQTTVSVCLALWLSELPGGNDELLICAFADGANLPSVGVAIQSTGVIEVLRNNHVNGATFGTWTTSTTTLGTSSGPVATAGSWMHFEVRVFHDNSAGTVDVYLNEVNVVNVTGADTISTGRGGTCAQVWAVIGDSNDYCPMYFDDLIIADNTGSYNTTVIGDKDVLTYWYDEDGTTSNWTASSGGAKYLEVDDAAQDGDATYIEATTASLVQELELSAVPSTVTGIIGVVPINLLRKTAAGSCDVRADFVESGGAAATGTNNVMTEEYAYYWDVVEVNPATSLAWDYSTLSASYLRLTRTT